MVSIVVKSFSIFFIIYSILIIAIQCNESNYLSDRVNNAMNFSVDPCTNFYEVSL